MGGMYLRQRGHVIGVRNQVMGTAADAWVTGVVGAVAVDAG